MLFPVKTDGATEKNLYSVIMAASYNSWCFVALDSVNRVRRETPFRRRLFVYQVGLHHFFLNRTAQINFLVRAQETY